MGSDKAERELLTLSLGDGGDGGRGHDMGRGDGLGGECRQVPADDSERGGHLVRDEEAIDRGSSLGRSERGEGQYKAGNSVQGERE